MNPTTTLNARAMRQADFLAMNAASLRIAVTKTTSGTRLLDCGINTMGGIQAGLGMARVCLAGQGEVSLMQGDVGGVGCPLVQVNSDHPVVACMASQYAGWQVTRAGKHFAMGSGPMRAIRGKEPLFDDIPGKEESPVAVGVLESRKLPDDMVISYITGELNIAPDKLTLLVAPAHSIAGTIQVVARSLETALHKMHELKFDLSQVVAGLGSAPLPPVGKDDLQSIGRTNDAILYGGRVILWVQADDDILADIGPKVPSNSSSDYGAPFASVFERYNHNFYEIDPMLFSPAEVTFHNLQSGRCHVFGSINADVLRQSFMAS